jgi:hypothetical protein
MNSPKQKAEELFEMMLYNDGDKYHHCSHYVGKNCALIAVNEIIKIIDEGMNGFLDSDFKAYCNQLKTEIEKL